MTQFRFSPRPNKAHEIAWRPWGPEAFAQAQLMDRPVLLSISAVWCHWCHVMDETTYSDAEVIRFINESFVPVRVDNDQRPEINARYNMGGWPTTAFLTPDGGIIGGGTYIAPQQMPETLGQVVALYRQRKADILRHAAELRKKRAERTQGIRAGAKVDSAIVDNVVRSVVAQFDPMYGGFGAQPKFPQVDSLALLLLTYQSTGDRWYLMMVEKTMDHMAKGGVFDHEEKGFFRYSTNRDWSVPHFEKMLDENVGLLKIYLHVYLATGNDSYRQVAGEIVEYLDACLFDHESGAFYGSQDADEEYYGLKLEDRRQRQAPAIDTTVYTNLNALAASAYLEAAWVLGKPECKERALRVLTFVWERCYQEGKLHHFFTDGIIGAPGVLADYASLAAGCMDAYRATGGSVWLERAEALAAAMRGRFWDPEGGAFFDIAVDGADVGELRVREKPLAENAVAAEALRKLYRTTMNEEYGAMTEKTLSALAGVYADHGMFAAGYAASTQRWLHPPVEVSIVGRLGAPDTLALARAALEIRYLHKEISVLDVQDRDALEATGYSGDSRAQAYICLDTVCLAPISEPERLAEVVTPLLASKGQVPSGAS